MKRIQGMQVANATTLVLAVLYDQERHGYDIAKEVERRSDQAIEFQHGTLYPILHGLEEDGLIVSRREKPEGERWRRVYSLTDNGLRELETRMKSWSDWTNAINKVLEGVPSES